MLWQLDDLDELASTRAPPISRPALGDRLLRAAVKLASGCRCALRSRPHRRARCDSIPASAGTHTTEPHRPPDRSTPSRFAPIVETLVGSGVQLVAVRRPPGRRRGRAIRRRPLEAVAVPSRGCALARFPPRAYGARCATCRSSGTRMPSAPSSMLAGGMLERSLSPSGMFTSGGA